MLGAGRCTLSFPDSPRRRRAGRQWRGMDPFEAGVRCSSYLAVTRKDDPTSVSSHVYDGRQWRGMDPFEAGVRCRPYLAVTRKDDPRRSQVMCMAITSVSSHVYGHHVGLKSCVRWP